MKISNSEEEEERLVWEVAGTITVEWSRLWRCISDVQLFI